MRRNPSRYPRLEGFFVAFNPSRYPYLEEFFRYFDIPIV